MHDSIQVTLYAATIEATPIECHGFNCILSGLSIDRICKLDFTTDSCGLIAQNIENTWSKNIATDAGKV